MPRPGAKRSRIGSGVPGTRGCNRQNGKADLLSSHLPIRLKTVMGISPLRLMFSRFFYVPETKSNASRTLPWQKEQPARIGILKRTGQHSLI